MAAAVGTGSAPGATDTAPARPDVFVSYSRRDKAWVQEALLPALTAAGKEVWVDLEDIPPAADWRERVMAGVAAANAVLFVVSPDSLTSAVCAEELARAVELNKRLVPVVRRDPAGAPVPPELARPNWVFLRPDDDAEAGLAAVREALDSDLEWRDAHSRLAVRTAEWLGHDRDRAFLLRGSDLRAAEDWLARQAEHEERPTAEQTRYVLASRQATTRRQRLTLAAVASALAIAIVLAVFALVQRGQAIDREQLARSRELAASALAVLPRDPELSVLLAAAGARTRETAEAEDALRRSLAESHAAATMRGHEGPVGAGILAGGAVVTAGHDGTVRVWEPDGRETAVLRGHAALLRGLTADRAGRRLVTTGEDGTASVWDRTSGEVTAALRGHRGTVHNPAFSPDGEQVLTAGLDGTARVWDAGSGRPVAVLPHRDAVFSAEYDRAGGRIVTASGDGSAIVWDARTGLALTVLRGHDGWVNRASFSPDGARVATAGEDGTARLWDARTGRQQRVLRGHGDGVRHVTFASDSRRLVTASDDATAVVWDVRGRRLADLRGHLDSVLRGRFSPDGRLVATTSSDNSARLWDAASGAPVAAMRGHTDEVGPPQFSRDGTRLLTVSDDGTARMWRVPEPPTAIDGGGGPLRGAAISADGTRVLTWSRSLLARLADARTGRVVRRFDVVATGGAFLPGRRLVLATGYEDAAQVRDAATGDLVRRLPGPPTQFLAASADGRRLLTVGFGTPEVRVWDTATGREVRRLGGRTPLGGAALSPDGRRAVTMGTAGGVTAWDVASGETLGTLRHHAGVLSPAAAFGPDGRLVLTSLHGPVPVWDGRAAEPDGLLRPRAQLPSEVVNVAWSGGLVAAADRGRPGAVRVFDVETGRVVAELRGHRHELRSVAFSPDGRWIATASVDRTARVWEAETGRLVAELLGHRRPLLSVTWAPDGRHVLTVSKGDTALLHDCAVCAPLGELAAMVPEHVSAGRRLTVAERREYLHEDG